MYMDDRNEQATSSVAIVTFDSLWDIRDGRTFFSGPLFDCADHQHGAPVFLAGLYGKFRLKLRGGNWMWCRTAIIPAGVVHALQVGGEPISVFYIEPTLAGVAAFRPLINNCRVTHGAWVGNGGEIRFMRDLYENRYQADWCSRALQELLDYAALRANADRLDVRLAQVIDFLHRHPDDLTSVSILAAQLGLSSSRFQHLFTQQIGVAFRRYRAWNRMRHAITQVVQGCDFTTAALAVGFADSAHFSHQFRRTFGAPPSVSLSKLARLQQ
jgi:AraC-like DNA-binding protein